MAPGLRGEAIARRTSLAALPDAAKEGGHPLAGAAAALFALHLRAWNCALRTVVVVAAPVDTDLAAALGGCRTLRELCLVDGRLGPEALAALWGAVRAAGLRLEAVRVDDAHHHRRLAPGAARTSGAASSRPGTGCSASRPRPRTCSSSTLPTRRRG
mgnify:CR=1 FL=1